MEPLIVINGDHGADGGSRAAPRSASMEPLIVINGDLLTVVGER